MVLRVLTWNVDGLRSMLQRRQEALHLVLNNLKADIICFQETKLSKSDLGNLREFTRVQGWRSYFGLCRHRTCYAGVVTFCKEGSVATLAAEEGLAGTDAENVSDSIGRPDTEEWSRFSKAELEHNDNEGRSIITDHGRFVLINLYGPATTNTQEERFTRKLTFYQALQLRVQHLVAHGRRVVIAGDLNIAHRPVDNCDWAESALSGEQLQEAFHRDRPDRKWFTDFLQGSLEGFEGAPVVDLLRRFHPERRKAYTVWGRTAGKRQRNFGSRVDYILAVEPKYDESSAREAQALSLTDSAVACDIWKNWEGSDHAPVWVDLAVELSTPNATPRLESAGRFRQQMGGQQQITSWLVSPRAKKRKRSAERSETPPRGLIGMGDL